MADTAEWVSEKLKGTLGEQASLVDSCVRNSKAQVSSRDMKLEEKTA